MTLANFVWWASIALQTYWHALGLLDIPADPETIENMSPLMMVGCSLDGFRLNYFPPGCNRLFTDLVRKSLQLSLLLIWWNPALKTRLRCTGGNYHWSGLGDFYRFQAVILTLRFGVWWTVTHSADYQWGSQGARGLHGLALFFICIGALSSQRMVKYLPAPKFSFRDTTQPLVDADSFQYPSDPMDGQLASHPLSASRRANHSTSFDIASLGPRREPDRYQQQSPASRFAAPPTPPPDADAADSMDWEPLSPRRASPMIRRTHNPIMNHSLPQQQPPIPAIPAFLRPAATASTGEKSPFTGRLPPAPMSPAHRLRNPPAPPQFKPTPLSKQQDFFKQMGLSSAALPLTSSFGPSTRTRSRDSRRRGSSATVEDNDDNDDENEASSYARQQTYLQSQKANDPFRPSQWTLKSDLDAARQGTGTGLEDMFSTSFKLGGDTPHQTPRKPRRAREVGGDGREVLESEGTARENMTAAKEIVGKNLRVFVMPVFLALLAVSVAVLRDEGARCWIVEVVGEGLRALKPFLGALGLQGLGEARGGFYQREEVDW